MIALTVVPYVFLFVAAQTISDYVAYRDIFHAGESTAGPPTPCSESGTTSATVHAF